VTAFIATIATLALAICPIARPASTGETLRYARPLGQRADYRLTLEAGGQQISLDEKIPVHWRGEAEYTEEVIAATSEADYSLRVRGGLVAVEDATGSLAGGMMDHWPDLILRVTPRGELLDVSLATEGNASAARERAVAALAAHPVAIVLPAGPADVGADWYWEQNGSRQLNRLLAVEESPEGRIAHIASTAYAPLRLNEQSQALGLRTHLEGTVSQESTMDLLLSSGVVARHKGEMHVQTTSTVDLALRDGGETFAMSSDLRIAFDARLLSIDGRPVTMP
jgi:hypothetical protein